MGRKKIKIQKITDEKLRNITFNKRKHGLLRKAAELVMLCEVKLQLCMTDFYGNIVNFYSSDEGVIEELEQIGQNSKVYNLKTDQYPNFFDCKKRKSRKKKKQEQVYSDEEDENEDDDDQQQFEEEEEDDDDQIEDNRYDDKNNDNSNSQINSQNQTKKKDDNNSNNKNQEKNRQQNAQPININSQNQDNQPNYEGFQQQIFVKNTMQKNQYYQNRFDDFEQLQSSTQSKQVVVQRDEKINNLDNEGNLCSDYANQQQQLKNTFQKQEFQQEEDTTYAYRCNSNIIDPQQKYEVPQQKDLNQQLTTFQNQNNCSEQNYCQYQELDESKAYQNSSINTNYFENESNDIISYLFEENQEQYNESQNPCKQQEQKMRIPKFNKNQQQTNIDECYKIQQQGSPNIFKIEKINKQLKIEDGSIIKSKQQALDNKESGFPIRNKKKMIPKIQNKMQQMAQKVQQYQNDDQII